MKASKINIFVFIISFLIISCDSKKKVSIPEFPVNERAKMITLGGDDLILPRIESLVLTDTAIVALGHLDNKWIHLYDRKNGNPLGSYIDRGEGPADIVSAGRITRRDGKWVIYDAMVGKIKAYAENFKFLSDETPSNNLPYPVISRKFFPSGKDLILTLVGEDETCRRWAFLLADSLGHGQPYVATPVDDNPDLAENYSRSWIESSPDGRMLVATTWRGCYMEIFDVSGYEPKLRRSQCFAPLKLRNEGRFPQLADSCVRGFSALEATDSRIIACLNGKPDEFGSTDITVWDWDGTPLKRYATGVTISNMKLSPDNPDEIFAQVYDKEGNFYLVKFICRGLLD